MARGSGITRRDLEGKTVAWEMGEGQVASSRNDALIKGYVARQKRRLKGHYYHSRPNSVRQCRWRRRQRWQDEKSVEEEEEEEEETKERRVLSWVGGSARQGGHDLLFRKVSRLLPQSTRGLSSVKNGRDDEGQRRCVLKFASLSSSKGRGEVEAEAFGEFCEFF